MRCRLNSSLPSCAVAFVLAAMPVAVQAESCNNPLELKERVRADLVFDLNSGRIIYQRNIDKPLHPASLTKMMAGVIMAKGLEQGLLDEDQKITFQVPEYKNFTRVVLPSGRERTDMPDALTRKGRNIEAENLLAFSITRSSNDGMFSVATAMSGSEENFVARMNTVALNLGMLSTHYTTSSGWPTPEALRTQRTTAFDQGILLRYVFQQSNYVQEFFRKPSVSFLGGNYPNTNKLMRDSDYKNFITASKTGFTCPSGRNVIMNVHINGHDFGVATFGHNTFPDRDERSKQLIQIALRDAGDEYSEILQFANFSFDKTTIPNPQSPNILNPTFAERPVYARLSLTNDMNSADILFGQHINPYSHSEPLSPPKPPAPDEEKIAILPLGRVEEYHLENTYK